MKYIKLSLSLIVIAAVAFFVLQNPKVARAVGSYTRSGADASSMRTSASTTTPNYLKTGTGTTTVGGFTTSDCSAITVYMNVIASSTSGAFNSVLNIQPQSSDDNLNWFASDLTTKNPALIYAASSTLALASSTVGYSWQPSSVEQTDHGSLSATKAFTINLVPSRYTRLIYTLAASTSNFTQQQSISIWSNTACTIQLY